MRERTYEIKDDQSVVIETGKQSWWNHTLVLSDLAPNRTTGISGMVSARGGWVNDEQWSKPTKPVVLQCSAARWAEMLAEELAITTYPGKYGVIDSIAKVLERLDDERTAPKVSPEPIPSEPDEPEGEQA